MIRRGRNDFFVFHRNLSFASSPIPSPEGSRLPSLYAKPMPTKELAPFSVNVIIMKEASTGIMF